MSPSENKVIIVIITYIVQFGDSTSLYQGETASKASC